MGNLRSSRVVKFIQHLLTSILTQLGALGASYGLLVSGYLLLYFTVGESFLPISLLNNGAHFIIILCIPAFLLALLAPRYRLLWVLYTLPGIIAFVIWYGEYFLPKADVSVNEEGIYLDVVTYNTSAIRAIPLEIITQELFDADIIGFQELSSSVQRATENPLEAYVIGKGIYSRYTIIDESIKFIGEFEEIISVRALVNIEGIQIAVYSFHPKRPVLALRPLAYLTEERNVAVQRIVSEVRQEPYPTLVLCDCNFSDRTDDYFAFSSVLTDAWRERGWGLGLTAPAPGGGAGLPFTLLRSDYIWHSEEFETVTIEVLPLDYSDHYPVKALLLLKSDS